ncbi:MAG: hypothetical protein JXB36_11975 [Gammaproteobacteria bacterium]|nr:hypothetical protein [Gammaproteobacteria bacterium]
MMTKFHRAAPFCAVLGAVAGAAADDTSAASAPGVEVTVDDGLRIAAPDEAFSIEIGGRLHVDWARHGGETPGAEAIDGTNVRRARLELGGSFDRDWRWAAEADFANNDVSLKDFRLGYRGLESVDLTVGHQKQPYSLAVEMSSNDIPFVERSVDSRLILPFVDRAIGVRADASGEHWFVATGVFGEAADPGDGADEGWGVSARVVYAPVIRDDRVLHFGLRAARREPSATETLQIRDETTQFSDLHVVDTGQLLVEDADLFGPEAAVAIGQLSLFSEYNRVSLKRRSAAALNFDSWHVAAAWALGGENRAAQYDIGSGEFKRLEAEQPFRRGRGGGTWELTTRYASIDLNDSGFVGGKEQTFGVGANWYAGAHVRFLLDWTRVVDTDASNAVRAAAEGLDVFTLRAQFTF